MFDISYKNNVLYLTWNFYLEVINVLELIKVEDVFEDAQVILMYATYAFFNETIKSVDIGIKDEFGDITEIKTVKKYVA